jgi:hypothetical protein
LPKAGANSSGAMPSAGSMGSTTGSGSSGVMAASYTPAGQVVR